MAEMNIFQRGDKAKFIITSQNVNLNMELCDFYVELIYGMRADKLTIQKADMFYGTDGEYVMIFDTSKMIGKIKVRFVWYCIDTDVDPNNRRQEVDEQYIGIVVETPCPQFFRCPKCESVGHDVTYIRTEESDIANKYAVLCDCNGVSIVTVDDEYICVLREIIK